MSLTETQIAYAEQGVEFIDEVAVGPNTATNRLGEEVKTVPKLIADMEASSTSSMTLIINALAAYNPRGPWVTLTNYALKDVVTNGGFAYAAVEAHVAGASFAADVAAGKWVLHQGVLMADLPVALGVSHGLVPVAVGDTATDHLALLNAALTALSSSVQKVLILAEGYYNFSGTIVPKNNVVVESPVFRPMCWYDRGVTFRKTAGAAAGTMIQPATGSFGWGFHGIKFYGAAAQNNRCIDYDAGVAISLRGNLFEMWGEQAIRSTGFSHLNHIVGNLAYNCAMYRIRAGFIGVFELSEVDSYIDDNEPGCSAIAEGPAYSGNMWDGDIYLDAAAKTVQMYNGVTPYIAAMWLKSGSGYNWVRGNNFEISEIGLIDDGFQNRFEGNRGEFNKAWGLLSRGAGGQHYNWQFNGNSRAGDNLFAHVRVEALSDGARPRQFYGMGFDNTTTAWGYVTSVLAEVEDVVFDTYPSFSEPTFYSIPQNLSAGLYPTRIKTNDRRIRVASQAPVQKYRAYNGCRNSGLEGAVVGVIGAGGALPTGWVTAGGTGLTVEVLAISQEYGIPYIRIKASGIPSAAFWSIVLSGWDLYTGPANLGEVHTASCFYRVPAYTTFPGSRGLGCHEIPAGGGNGINQATSVTLALPGPYVPLDQCRNQVARTLSNAAVHRVGAVLTYGLSTVTNYDFTFDIGLPQVERGPDAGAGLVTQPTQTIYPKATLRTAQATGTTYTTPNRTEHVILSHAATIAALTVVMPSMSHGDLFTLSTVAAVTALTLTPAGGQTFAVAAPATLAAGASQSWRFDAADGKLYPA